jgi:hypothetical protein
VPDEAAVCSSPSRGSTRGMSEENSDVKIDADLDRGPQSATPGSSRRRLWVNWVLALLTVVAAAVVMAVALGSVMSTAACSDKQCPSLGPDGISFNVLFYGAPVVAALTIVVSFLTARRRWGFVVPASALALLVADATVIAATVAQ